MTDLPLQRLLLDVIAVIQRLSIPYVIMGGFAVRSWGVPRPTYDVDLAVAVDESALVSFLGALERAGFTVPETYKHGTRDLVASLCKVSVSRVSDREVWGIDLFLARGAFLESAVARGRLQSLEDQVVRVMAPEDLVLLKLLAYRRKDQLDVEEIVKITTSLDRPYLDEWATYLGVADRLREFLPNG